MKPKPTLIQNAIHILADDVYIQSVYHHDYVTHGDYAVDGGKTYLRRGYPTGGKSGYEEWSLYSNSPFKEICTKLLWGTYGKDGKEPLRYVPLAKCELGHLIAIRDTQFNIAPLHLRVVQHWIKVKRAASKPRPKARKVKK